ncbi:MAG: murein biosynthesis integral membrane protein MurJ [Bacteroidota bacterium]|nr:murein biosynthesis integral membrane protein MurJ [Bacteroidota bacterium]
MEASRESASGRSRAIIVAVGIFISRIFGLLRWSLIARYFAVGPHADVLKAAFSVPNLLQNLLGEGTLSAAFVPVYSRMLEEGRTRDAGRFAGSIFGLLLVVVSASVLLGMVLAHPICWILMRGFAQDAAGVSTAVDRLALATDMVRLAFPMAGLLVLSAWALGVLNSHRRFLVPYLAPVAWNVAIISALLIAGTMAGLDPSHTAAVSGEKISLDALTRVLKAAFLGGLLGGALQLLVQLPFVARVIRGFRLSWSMQLDGVRTALRAAGPAIAGRGVAQLSAWMDLWLASFLVVGAVAALAYAQVLYLLPISLFGMSVAAAELPELSRFGRSNLQQLTGRLEQGLGQGLLLVVPTALGYLTLGYAIVGGIYGGGLFGADDTLLTYSVLATYSLGLVATVSSRLMHNGFWALGDTRTPARMAGVRLAVSVAVAVPAMLLLDTLPLAGLSAFGASPLFFGAAGLALGSAVAAWVEFGFLLRALARKLERPVMPWRRVGVMVLMAVAAALPAAGLWYLVSAWSPVAQAVAVVAVFGALYLLLASRYCPAELRAWSGRLARRVGPKKR